MKKYHSVPGTELHKELWLYFDRVEMGRYAIKSVAAQYGVVDFLHDPRSPVPMPTAYRFGENPVPGFFIWSESLMAYVLDRSKKGASLFVRRLLEGINVASERNITEMLAFEPYSDSEGNLVLSPKVTEPSSWDGVFVVEIDDEYAGDIHYQLSLQKDEQ